MVEKNISKAVSNLVDWKNPPEVSDLDTDMSNAEAAHNEQIKKVENHLDRLAAKLKVKIPTGRSKVQPKLIRTNNEWRYASLEEPFLSAKDLWDIKPRTGEDKEGADQNKLLLNYQWNTLIDKVDFINEFVRTAVDEGTVIVQVGWHEEEELQDVEVDIEATPEQAQLYYIQQVQQGLMAEEEAMMAMQSDEPLVVGTKMVEKKVTVANHPTYRICEYDKCVIDPTCEGDLDKAEFIAMPFESSMSGLKRSDDEYDNLDMIFGKDDEGPSADASDDEVMNEESAGFDFTDKARKKLTVYEYYGYWDIDDTGITKPIKAVWVNKIMIKLEELPYPDKKLPFVAVQYLPVRKSVYGEPDGVLLEDKQDILGATYRGMIDIMGRTANGQTGMAKGMLDAAQQKKYNNGEDYLFNQGFDPRYNIHTSTFPDIPNSALTIANMQTQEAESLTGTKVFGGGISGNSLGDTSGNGRRALDSAAKRELSILRRLSKGMEKIGRKSIAMNAVWLDEEEVIRVTDDDFVTVRKDDLTGKFDMRLSISTAESDNQKAEELAFMQQTMSANQDPEITKMIQAEQFRLRNMPELAERVENFVPEPDPFQQQMQQLELELKQAQVFNEQAKGQENAVDVDLKKAKTVNEEAKARNAHSQSDKLDQDFLEKDAGIDHEKELDKKDVDHANSMESKQMDALLKPQPGKK